MVICTLNSQVVLTTWIITIIAWQNRYIHHSLLHDFTADHAPYDPRQPPRHHIPHEPQAPEVGELTITASAPDAKYGDYLDLHCRSNEQGVVVTWTKVNDRLADNVQIHGAYLRFVSLRTDNNGVYRCETRGQSGYYYKDYVVDVIGKYSTCNNRLNCKFRKV